MPAAFLVPREPKAAESVGPVTSLQRYMLDMPPLAPSAGMRQQSRGCQPISRQASVWQRAMKSNLPDGARNEMTTANVIRSLLWGDADVSLAAGSPIW